MNFTDKIIKIYKNSPKNCFCSIKNRILSSHHHGTLPGIYTRIYHYFNWIEPYVLDAINYGSCFLHGNNVIHKFQFFIYFQHQIDNECTESIFVFDVKESKRRKTPKENRTHGRVRLGILPVSDENELIT